MTDRPFAADGDPAVAPEPGYYPDPSIPGFVRYWGGSAWVPGTSRLAPVEGEVLPPPRFAARRPAPDAAAPRVVPPPVVPVPAARSDSPLPEAGPGSAPLPEPVHAAARAAVPVPVPSPGAEARAARAVQEGRGAREAPGPGETGPVYLDQTTGGASFVVGPRAAEVIGGPVFRTVEPAAEQGHGPAGSAAASGWQADPQAQRGLMETGGAPRWVSWGVLPEALEDEEGRAEPERAAVAVEVAAALAPAMAVAVREVPAPVVTGTAVPVVGAEAGSEAEAGPERASGPAAVAAPARTVRPVPVPAVVPARSPAPAPAVVPVRAVARATAPAALPVARPAREAPVHGRSNPAARVPAGLGRRLAARAVDTAVLLVVAVAAGVPLGSSVSDHLRQKLDQARMASSLTRRQVQVWLVDDVVLAKLAALVGILVFVSLVYEVLPIARTGQTFGKRLARIRVVDATAPGGRARLGLGRSLLRWVVRQLGVILLLGLVWPVLDRPARRGWQDRAARTRVVRV
ncbi:RDD family protein [Kitasatospora sp. NPDC089797]|uniref:RDD family protein n=1 Tax=Kitasatospora sp. NPDC089797 TaxID=3155298 RepID=UPI00341646CA